MEEAKNTFLPIFSTGRGNQSAKITLAMDAARASVVSGAQEFGIARARMSSAGTFCDCQMNNRHHERISRYANHGSKPSSHGRPPQCPAQG